MHRMTQAQFFSRFNSLKAIAVCAAMYALPVTAQMPLADADYDASGYVTPAGMAHPSMYQGGVVPAGMTYSAGLQGGPTAYPGGVMPVGFLGGQCDGNCASCDPGAAACGCNKKSGILGGLTGSGLCGCGLCGNGDCFDSLSKYCFFCRGSGCLACKSISLKHLGSNLAMLEPYGEICGLRWYDASLEAVFLGHTQGVGHTAVTGVGTINPPTNVALYLDDANGGDELAAGVRISGALIFGVGGNIEATYMGGNKWSRQATATSATNDLNSFITDFGTAPSGPLDDLDQSSVQSIGTDSEMQSIELNYRRRTMGPYCRFQGSWLIGLRYLQFDNSLSYMTSNVPTLPPRFFESHDRLKNNMFGAQVGGDAWWNIHSGVRLGMGLKAAWVQNEINRSMVVRSNSVATTTLNETMRDNSLMGEFQLKFVWQFNHSWKFRTAYYAIAAEDIAFGSIDKATILSLAVPPPVEPKFVIENLVIQGISFGTEYNW